MSAATLSATRAFVLWVPDWPVVAAASELALDAQAPLALIHKGVVFACSGAARSTGVARGLKQREAQYRCPNITVVRYDESTDARRFEPCVRALEQTVPGVQVLRPGLLAVRARGPVRYFGGEMAAAHALQQSLLEQALCDVRVGCAEGVFAAEQAARATTATDPIRTVPADLTADFLAPMSIELVSPDERTATVLRRLGVTTLGKLAALPIDDVHRRFGASGAWAHEQAAGRDPQRLAPRVVPPELTVTFETESPIERSDEVAFAIRSDAERFDSQLRERRLVCTALQVELTDEHGTEHRRLWLHPRWFQPGDIVDRVRWQLDGLLRVTSAGADARLEIEEYQRAGIVRVRLLPDRVDEAAHHESGLWGGGPDERVHHALSRLQGVLGPHGVATAVLTGGRSPASRQQYVSWGDAPPAHTRTTQPWPGSLPGLAPASVIEPPVPVDVLDATGATVDIDSRGSFVAPPKGLRLRAGHPPRELTAWAGPWPLIERWWDEIARRESYRCQVVDSAGDAWLLRFEDYCWHIEARYD